MQRKNYFKIILLLLICTPLFCNSQFQIKKGAYRFTENILPFQSKVYRKGVGLKAVNTEIKEGYKITVLGVSEDLQTVYFRFGNFGLSYPEEIRSEYNNHIFEIPTTSFMFLTEQLYPRFKGVSYGVYTIPFRLRGSKEDFDFESSLSLQANLVFGFGKKTKPYSWVDLSVGLGITNINLNKDNTETPANQNFDDRTATALTASFGAVIKPSRFTNFGVFFGWDTLGLTEKNINWKYDRNIWVGLGLNVSFNEVSTDKSTSNTDNKKFQG